jgi:riboflavin synthase
MFTGLIKGIGKVKSVSRIGGDMKVTIEPLFPMDDVEIGDSISVDGVCLTVTEVIRGVLSMDISEETISRSTLESLKQAMEVNLEPALRLNDRLGGHIVSGHVDCVGRIVLKERRKQSWIFKIEIEKNMTRYIIEKGSIAVDGISLTVNRCDKKFFDVNIIPHTGKETTLLDKRVGDKVNIETDLIGKYVEKLLLQDYPAKKNQGKASILDMETLIKNGFGD